MLSTPFFELFDSKGSTVETHTRSFFSARKIMILLTSHPLQAVCLICEHHGGRRQESCEKLCERRRKHVVRATASESHVHSPSRAVVERVGPLEGSSTRSDGGIG
jgi:hypothetical protein